MRNMNESFRLLGAVIALVGFQACGDPQPKPDADADVDGDGTPSGSCQPTAADRRDGEGPRPLLLESVLAERPAGLGIDTDSVTQETVTIGSDQVYVIRFQVTSFQDRAGRDWVHPVVIVAPAFEDLAATDAAATSAGMGTLNPVAAGEDDPTWGSDYPGWFRGTTPQSAFIASYGSIVVTNRIPMVFTNVVPDEIELAPDLVAQIHEAFPPTDASCESDCVGPQGDEEDIRDCLTRAALATGDLTLASFLNFAVAHMRILDASERVLEQIYSSSGTPVDLSWSRIWTIGSSKRGITQRILAALDPRIQGVIVSAADVSNFVDFLALEGLVWEAAYSFGGPANGLLLQEPVLDPWLRAFDAFRWRPEVLGDVDYVLAVGTNDHLYPIAASLLYREALPGGFHMLMVPNYGHGCGAVDHVAAFRALIDHGLNGTPWPRIEARWDVGADLITAHVLDGEVERADLWCATDLGPRNELVFDLEPPACTERIYPEPVDGSDLRDAVWESVPMDQVESDIYQATPLDSSLTYPACFVRALTADGKPATSGPLLSAALCEASGLVME